MEKDFSVTILSQDKKLYEGRVKSLNVPAETGYLGVLANHDFLISNLVSGKITIRKPSDELLVINSKGKGFLEVSKNNATILLISA
jgi:F-type H+-transporting ATPase subunit epsilon